MKKRCVAKRPNTERNDANGHGPPLWMMYSRMIRHFSDTDTTSSSRMGTMLRMWSLIFSPSASVPIARSWHANNHIHIIEPNSHQPTKFISSKPICFWSHIHNKLGSIVYTSLQWISTFAAMSFCRDWGSILSQYLRRVKSLSLLIRHLKYPFTYLLIIKIVSKSANTTLIQDN